jgi:hypothetical protein
MKVSHETETEKGFSVYFADTFSWIFHVALILLRKVLFDNQIVAELVEKSYGFYGTERESVDARHARGLHSARKITDVTSTAHGKEEMAMQL